MIIGNEQKQIRLRPATTAECQEDVLMKIVEELGGSVIVLEEVAVKSTGGVNVECKA